jgi:hypothetical protein
MDENVLPIRRLEVAVQVEVEVGVNNNANGVVA